MSMELVSGSWKTFDFHQILPEDYEKVLEFLRNTFYLDEPIQKAVGMTEDRSKDLDTRLTHFIKMGLSFMAIDQVSKEIVGCLLLKECVKGKPNPEFEPTSPLTKIVRSFLIQLDELITDPFERYGVDRFADIYILSVSKSYRGKGLASEMFRRALEVVKAMGYPLVSGTFTNSISRRIARNFGFNEVDKMYFHEAVDEQGKGTIPKNTADQFVNFMILVLDEDKVKKEVKREMDDDDFDLEYAGGMYAADKLLDGWK